MHTNRCTALQFGRAGSLGRWLRYQRPSPAAVGGPWRSAAEDNMQYKAKISLWPILFFVCLTALVPCQETNGADSTISLTTEQLDTMESKPDDHPVFVMRLLKYRGEEGEESHKKYNEVAVSRIRELGGDVVFFGKGKPFTIPDNLRSQLPDT